MSEWGVLLNGVYLTGCEEVLACPEIVTEASGLLSGPPDGLGQPDIRTEDVSYVQRDGVRHFSDWYGPRIITLAGVTVCPDDCPACPSARVKYRDIMQAWKRQCDDVELVIFTDCHGEDSGGGDPAIDRALVGPFGVVGRPRVAVNVWDGGSKCATLTLRFDARDHLMYVLDACGTPGSGVSCTTLTPDTLDLVRCYSPTRCYPRCYTVETGDSGGPQDTLNVGTECAALTITLYPSLSHPFIENVSTGERLDYNGDINDGDAPVIIDTATGTATQGGQPRTHLLSGSIRMTVEPGTNTLRLGSFSSSDDGTAEVCFRAAVVAA